jgi:hypothetical protein
MTNCHNEDNCLISLKIWIWLGKMCFDHQKVEFWSPKYVCCEMITKKGVFWSPNFLAAKWSPKNECFDHQIQSTHQLINMQ